MTPIIELLRIDNTYAHGMFGVLRMNKRAFCVTLEPPDKFNLPGQSCIPAGQYTMRRVQSMNFGETFEVEHVPGRTLIRLHPGNTVHDTSGCIILAQHYGKLGDDRAVVNSGHTFREFLNLMNGYDIAHLTITEHF